MKYKIFCFWSEMSPNRKSCYESIIDNSECDVILVTDDNLIPNTSNYR